MCWHTVTLRLNTKLFFFSLSLSGIEGERWIYGAAAACPGYCELAAFWSCQSVLRPPVCAGTLSGFTPVRRAELLMASPGSPHLATELIYSKPPGPRLLVMTFLHPFSSPLCSSPHLSVCSLSVYPLYSLSPVMGQTDKATAPLLTVGLGVLCFLFINGDFVSGTVPLRRYLDNKRLVPFTTYY